MGDFMRVEDLEVYQKLCQLHIEVCELTRTWPPEVFVAKLKGYISNDTYESYRERYRQCVRMLNGLERKLERQLEYSSRRWPSAPDSQQ